MGKEQSLHQIVLGQLDSHVQNNEVGLYLMPYTKVISKWIHDLCLRAKATKFLEENIGVTLHDLGFGYGFLARTSKA